jgi:hypothetical protein
MCDVLRSAAAATRLPALSKAAAVAPHPNLTGWSHASPPVLRTPAGGERGRASMGRRFKSQGRGISLLPVMTGRRCRQADVGQRAPALDQKRNSNVR